MAPPTEESSTLREALTTHRREVQDVMRRYGARDPRLFGSVARGEAGETSDLDILVDLEPHGGNELLRVSGIGEELSIILGTKVDVVTPSLLREPVSATALADAINL